MNHSRNLDAVLQRGYEHQPSQSPYQQFQQEYPQLDEYGRKVASGRQFKETMGTLASALDNTSGQLMEGKADTGAGNIMDYMGFGAMTKVKPSSFDDLMRQTGGDNLPEMFKRQSGMGDNVEYHLSSEPDLIPGKTFAEQKRTVSTLGERGQGEAGQGDNIFTTRDPDSWRDQFEMELGQDAPEAIPQNLYEVMVKNRSPEGYLGEASNAPADVRVLRKIINELDPLGEGSIPYFLKKQSD